MGRGEARLVHARGHRPPRRPAAVLDRLSRRVGDELRFHIKRSDGGVERTRNTLRHLDSKRIWGNRVEAASGGAAPRPCRGGGRRGWVAVRRDRADRSAPDPFGGGSDVLCELELDSSDHVPSRRPARRSAQPDTRAGRDRAAVPRVRKAGLRGLAADGAPVLRAHGRGGITGSDHGPERALRHGECRDTGTGLARGGPFRLADDLRGALHRRRMRVAEEAERPVRASLTFQVCEPVKASGFVARL